MNRPEKLVLYDGGYLAQGLKIALAGISFLIFIGGFAMVMTDAPLAQLILPICGMSSLWFLWVAIYSLVAWYHRSSDKRDIIRLFKGESWAHWQYRSLEWQKIVDAEYQAACPEEGAKPYEGAVNSSIFGLVLAAIMIAAGKFILKDPEIMPTIWVIALAVFLLLLGIGLFQPGYIRLEAEIQRRKAQRVSAPRIWFASEGIYHEALGFTSLKDLKKVTDQTRTRNAIKFTILVTVSEGSDYLLPVSYPVPSGCEQQASQLVRRYRQEHLSQ